MQTAAGAELFHRLPDATLRLTQTGTAIMAHAERMEREAEAIGQTLGDAAQKIAGTVRITSVPIVVNRLLVPALPSLLTEHPHLVVEFVPDARDLSLTQREADLAIRLARPSTGGTRVKARRFGTLTYGIFAARDIDVEDARELDWITYDETMSHLPQSRWLTSLGKGANFKKSFIRVVDAETAMEAAACGLGKALLPTSAGNKHPRLQPIEHTGLPMPEREVWLLSHAEQRNFASVQAVIGWINTINWT